MTLQTKNDLANKLIMNIIYLKQCFYFWWYPTKSLYMISSLWKPDTAISIVRIGALWKATKRTNAKMKFHFFVLATCIMRQNEQTTKRNGHKPRVVVLSFWRLVKVDKANKRQNEQITTTNQSLIFCGNFIVLSFRRALREATKRTNEEMKFHFFVLETCTTRQNEENEEMKFCFGALAFVRFGALTNATKRTNEEMKFHFFVLATCTTRQNEQTKKRNLVLAFSRLFVFAP